VRALGAVAFVAPAAGSGEILRALHDAALHEDEAPARPTRAASAVTASDVDLTEREREVLALLVTGATNREIAAALHLGPDSIRKHATGLYRKLGVRNHTQAAQRAADLLQPA
jgi:two-component system response regulator DesR